MLTPGQSLPFYLDDLYSGLARLSGLIRIEGDYLRLEFQTQDNLIGVIKGNSRTKFISLRDIFKVELKSSWFSRLLVIRPSTLQALDGIPGADESELKLKFKRRDLEIAKHLVSQLNLRISEIRLEDLDE
jgi:hypothetical protein